MLQNRYGDTEFPIRDRWAHARLYRQALLQTRPSWAAARNLIGMAPAIVLLTILFVSTDGFNAVPNGDRGGLFVLVEIGGSAVLVAAGLTVATWIDRRKPRLEQQQYWAATRAAPITPEQQQLLALDAQSDYGFGGWNSSLDYGPAWSRMPAEAQERHRHDPKWRPFPTMPPMETDQLRSQLDTHWHIASGNDLELFVADALSDQSLSVKYRQVLQGEQGERMLARVSSLTGVDQWDLRALTEPGADRPAAALWAADTQRVISVVRMAHLADHVDAATAWELIEHAARPATSLCTNWDQYWAGVRIGLAFHTDSLDALQRFDQALAGLQASSWPAARIDFPRSRVPSWLNREDGPGTRTAPDQPDEGR